MAELPSRELAVILHADVVGSTSLVKRDETVAHTRVQDVFHRLSNLVKGYGGMTSELRGDALVAEFNRASDAVCAALAFQAENGKFNDTLEDEIRPEVRIGIGMGEVVIADNTVTGAGVVIAQRLEQLAEPGGVCIQGAAYETIPQRLPFEYASLGERKIKGFEEPVRAYAVTWRSGEPLPGPERHAVTVEARHKLPKRRWIAAGAIAVLIIVGGGLAWLQSWKSQDDSASVVRTTYPLPDKPSIAVLPFDNLSGDTEQEFFADGFTEDLITDLSNLRGLFVIARHSSFAYKGRSVDVREVGHALGVRFVLEGSVRKSGNSVRVNVQLVDAITGDHIWAERYDRKLADIFSLQDDIRQKVISELDITLVEGEQARAWRKTTDNVEAYKLFLQGREHHLQFTKESNYRAKELLERAVELDPEFAMGWAYLGWTMDALSWPGWSQTPERYKQQAIEFATRALALDESLGNAHALLGESFGSLGQIERSLKEFDRAMSLSPNDSKVLAVASLWHSNFGMPDKGQELIQKAQRINPLPPHWFHLPSGLANYGLGKYEEALLDLEQCTAQLPDFIWCYFPLAMINQSMGRADEAQSAARNILRIAPDYRIEGFRSESEKRLLSVAGLPG